MRHQIFISDTLKQLKPIKIEKSALKIKILQLKLENSFKIANFYQKSVATKTLQILEINKFVMSHFKMKHFFKFC